MKSYLFNHLTMLSIFILVSAATAFARLALDKNRNRYLWGAIGVVSYFLT